MGTLQIYIISTIKIQIKLICCEMTETPKIAISKFTTQTLTERSNKINSHFFTKKASKKSNTSLLNPQISLNFKSIDETSLPKIQTSRRKSKKGGFLQSWLDEALDSNDIFNPNASNKKQIDGGMFKTLHKFELDKRHLQSQNIPAEIINKLYNNLYIYSHGINNIFTEIMQFVNETKSKDLLNNFWRAFIKLLEGCTSYQTVFQQIEKKHLETIVSLKHNVQVREEYYQEERKEYERRIQKLTKELQDKNNKFQILANEYKVIESTLQLTDDAFNEEVFLRLKFEEKINAVYTSYQELKVKYGKLVEEMGIKNQYSIHQQNKEVQLKNQILIEKVKVQELQHLLKLEQKKVGERQIQVLIKKQQLEDMKETFMRKINREEEAESMMEQYLTKIKSLKTKLAESENVIGGLKTTVREHEQFIGKLQKKIQEMRKYNNEIYNKYVDSGKEITTLQSKISVNQLNISDLNGSLLEKTNEICDLERQLNHVKDQRDHLQKNLEISQKDLSDRIQVVKKNAILIDDLKAVKDKYQRINDILLKEKNTLEILTNQSGTKLSLIEEELEGMKLLLDTRNKTIAQMEKQAEQERQTNKVKHDSLNSQLSKKQGIILENQKKIEKNEDEMRGKMDEISQLADKIALVTSEKLKLEIMLSGKTKANADLSQENEKMGKNFNNLNLKFEESLKNKDQIKEKLNSTEYILKTKNKEDHLEVTHLKSLLIQYQELLKEKSQYIHPMIYEEIQGLIRRAKETEEKALNEHQKMSRKNVQLIEENEKHKKNRDQFVKQIEGLKGELNNYKEKAQKSQKKVTQYKLKLVLQVKKVNDLNLKVQQHSAEQQKSQEKLQHEWEKVKELRKIIREDKQQIQRLNGEILNLTQRKVTEKSSRMSARSRKFEDAEMQTDAMKEKTEKSEKIVEKIEEKEEKVQMIDAECQTEIEQKKEEEKQEEKEIKEEEQKKQSVPQQKVLKKDFKKALKLTFMRR